jgi:hypothetical protein
VQFKIRTFMLSVELRWKDPPTTVLVLHILLTTTVLFLAKSSIQVQLMKRNELRGLLLNIN